MMESVRVGIVGCGGISHAHAQAIAASESVHFAACCDIAPTAAESFRDTYGCERAYTDYEQMIREHELDGILLATWPNQHHEQVLRALDVGARNILCEKSLTVTGAEAVDLWRATREADAFLMEGFMYRHHPAIHRIEEILATGELGAVDHVSAAFSIHYAEGATGDDRNWRQRADRAGGVPWDLACYCVNACNHFAGSPPVRIVGISGTSAFYGTVDRVYCVIEYAGGAVGVITSSHHGVGDQELSISCELGKVRLAAAWLAEHDMDLGIERPPAFGQVEREAVPVPNPQPHGLQLENFAAVIRGEAEPGMPLAESVVNMFTIEAMVDSAARGQAVDITVPSDVTAELVAA
jgi:predicted dehydrogenase